MRGEGTHFFRRARLRVAATGLAVAAAAMLLAACGESSSDKEPGGEYELGVSSASFPTLQRLGQTSLLRLSFVNEGEKEVPNLVVTFSLAGRQGATSWLPFGVHEPQVGLANPTRPVWVLAEHFPKLAGSTAKGGATTSDPKTFAFGPLKPGQKIAAVFKLSAVRQGHYALHYTVGAGLSGEATAKTASGVTPGGTFIAAITAATPNTEVTDSGEIVEIPAAGR
ncbi:MAG: hypothetical protein JST31_16965 [Actinobacteria bacterium]|nr:hypothetical protein [Actinomycetota bacterium]